jgi:hypothetical protein
MQKKAPNTVPVPHSTYFGEVMHMDIIFGPKFLMEVYTMVCYL